MSTRLLHDKFFRLAKVQSFTNTDSETPLPPPPPHRPALVSQREDAMNLLPGADPAVRGEICLQAARHAKEAQDYSARYGTDGEPSSLHPAPGMSVVPRPRMSILAGSNVLDLGCAPGAWLQVACQALGRGEKGLVLGVDLKPRLSASTALRPPRAHAAS